MQGDGRPATRLDGSAGGDEQCGEEDPEGSPGDPTRRDVRRRPPPTCQGRTRARPPRSRRGRQGRAGRGSRRPRRSESTGSPPRPMPSPPAPPGARRPVAGRRAWRAMALRNPQPVISGGGALGDRLATGGGLERHGDATRPAVALEDDRGREGAVEHFGRADRQGQVGPLDGLEGLAVELGGRREPGRAGRLDAGRRPQEAVADVGDAEVPAGRPAAGRDLRSRASPGGRRSRGPPAGSSATRRARRRAARRASPRPSAANASARSIARKAASRPQVSSSRRAAHAAPRRSGSRPTTGTSARP